MNLEHSPRRRWQKGTNKRKTRSLRCCSIYMRKALDLTLLIPKKMVFNGRLSVVVNLSP